MKNSIWLPNCTKPRPIVKQPACDFKGRLMSQFENFASRHTYLETRFHPPPTPPPKTESLSIAPTLQPNLLATGKKGGQNMSLIINIRPLFEVQNMWILPPCSSVFYGLVFKNRFFTLWERGINHQSKHNIFSFKGFGYMFRFVSIHNLALFFRSLLSEHLSRNLLS